LNGRVYEVGRCQAICNRSNGRTSICIRRRDQIGRVRIHQNRRDAGMSDQRAESEDED